MILYLINNHWIDLLSKEIIPIFRNYKYNSEITHF
jgi:hypothetical protein